MLNSPWSKLVATVIVTLLTLQPPSASAGVIFYTSETTFLAAVSNPSTDTFDDLPTGSFSSPVTRVVGSYSYQAASTPGNFYNLGPSDIWLSTEFPLDVINFSSFSGGVFGAGAYLFGTTRFGDFLPGITINVSVTDSSGTYSASIVGASTTSFLGWVSDLGLLSFTVSDSSISVEAYPTVNNLVLGGSTEIPEPSTVALSALGLLVLAFARLRRKQ